MDGRRDMEITSAARGWPGSLAMIIRSKIAYFSVVFFFCFFSRREKMRTYLSCEIAAVILREHTFIRFRERELYPLTYTHQKPFLVVALNLEFRERARAELYMYI